MPVKSDKRSPLKRPPRRQAGQSLWEQLHAEILGPWLLFMTISWTLVVLAGLEWVRWAWNWKPQPLVWTLAALLAAALATWRIVRGWRHAADVVLGSMGERAVDEALRPLTSQGYHLFHDLAGRRGNIDHVLVGPAGVFAVETKTARKPARGPTVIRYDGTRVHINGQATKEDPLAQARAVAGEVSEYLGESTGRRVSVRPVLCYPGWFVEGEQEAPVWVLNPDRVLKWVLKEEKIRGRMSGEDVALYSERLAAWSRRDPEEA